MMRTRHVSMVVLLLCSRPAFPQQPSPVLEAAASAMGAEKLTSIRYSGSGFNFAFGQSPRPDAPWPRFNLKSYVRAVDYKTPASREELLRTQGENPPRGGGGQPLSGEQRQVFLVSGSHSWNMAGDTPAPAPAALSERQLQIWLTPHGLIKAAIAESASVGPRAGGKKGQVVSFKVNGKYTVNGYLDERHLVEKTETWLEHPVLGDLHIETDFSDYREFGGVWFPARILQKQDGFPTLDLTVSEVLPNAETLIEPPEAVRQAAAPTARVEAERVATGVWYLTGGSHHSVAVDFRDHLVVIEGPQNDERSLAVIAEVKKLAPGKPIKYLINTHHHFDHSGGIRAYAAEGATLITHEVNRAFYEKAFAGPRQLAPDALARSGKKARFETVRDKRELTDGLRTLAIHHVQSNLHNEGLLMVYLPAEKLLIEADAYTPGPPGAPPPSPPNPFSVNLHDNLKRLGLEVKTIAPLHGRHVMLSDLLKAIGRPPTE